MSGIDQSLLEIAKELSTAISELATSCDDDWTTVGSDGPTNRNPQRLTETVYDGVMSIKSRLSREMTGIFSSLW